LRAEIHSDNGGDFCSQRLLRRIKRYLKASYISSSKLTGLRHGNRPSRQIRGASRSSAGGEASHQSGSEFVRRTLDLFIADENGRTYCPEVECEIDKWSRAIVNCRLVNAPKLPSDNSSD
jgi:transposase InsO family protein